MLLQMTERPPFPHGENGARVSVANHPDAAIVTWPGRRQAVGPTRRNNGDAKFTK